MSTPFKLEPPDEEIASHLRMMANSAALRPADPRYVTFRTVSKLDKLKSQGGKTMQPDPATGEPKEIWIKGEGRPVHKAVEYVTILCPGDKDTIVDRPVNKLDPYCWPEKYIAFRNNQSQEMNGVPLEKWGGIPQERVADFAAMRITTVEQLADVPDGNLSALGMHARAEREKARGYLAVMKGNAPVAEMKAENERLKAEQSAMAERLAKLEALAAQSDVKAEKKGKSA